MISFTWLFIFVSSTSSYVSALDNSEKKLCSKRPVVYITEGYVEKVDPPENLRSPKDCFERLGNIGNMVWQKAAISMFDHERNQVTDWIQEFHEIPDLLVIPGE